ncbi:MAG: hypothetical protein U1F83_16020, partial [Verrucomicrobiota bacterium]
MPSRKPSRPWKLLRIYFRRFRIGVWLCVLLICGALLYVNQVGLPDFVKNPVLERLEARGLHLQFTRLRWHFPYGIVADNVLFGGGTNAAVPVFTVREVQVKLDYRALLHRQLQVDSLVLNQGRFAWQLNESNRPPRDFLVENIQTELRLLPGDLWRLDHFRAQFAGAGIRLSGLVTNASAIRDWKLFLPDPAGRAESGGTLQKNLRQVAEVFDRIHFATTPELTVDIDGDARRLPDFAVRVTLRADDASTPWGDFDRVIFSARAQPKENDEPTQCEIVLRAAGARTPWAMAEDVELTMHALSNAATNFNADLNCTAARVGSEWGNGTRLRFTAKWRHSVTNAIPRSGTGRLQLEVAETPWGVGRDLDVAATLTTLTNLSSEPGSASAWWMDLSPYELQVESRLAAFAAVQLRATNVVCSANWRAPQLTVQRLSADLQDGQLALQGGLDAGTHEVSFHVTSGCSPQKFPLLQKYFKDVQFVVPPQLDVSGTVHLPSTDRGLESWLNEAWADTKLAGRLSFDQATFRGTAFESARVQFSRTNQAWDVPDLRVVRPEGGLESSVQFDERTGDLALKLHSRLDLNVARAFLSPADQEPLDLARFTEP